MKPGFPVTRMPYWVRRRIFQREVQLIDFAGGLNLRDAPSELANNESPDLYNVTLDERGGIQKRFGFIKKNAAVYTVSSPPQNLFEWKKNGVVITQCGTKLFKDDGVSAVQTFSTAARVGFAEFGTAIWAIHPIDGLYTSTDGTSWSAVSGSPKGTVLEPWQNRLLALGDPGATTTLYASAIGDATDWVTTAGHGWTNKIQEHDSEPLIGMKAASGVDIAGKVGLVVCKNRSTYRVNDPNTGAYQTIDTTVGAASALAMTNLYGTTYVLHQSGIYSTNGVTELVLLSGKLQPLFDPAEIAYDQLTLYCAGVKGDRVHFSLPRAGSTANDLHLEYHATQGWFVAGSDAASCYLTYTSSTEKLYGGSPTVNGQVWVMGVGGSDNAVDIACHYQTKWLSPGGGIDQRYRRLRVFGRGTFSVFVKLDFDTGTGIENKVVLPGGAVWGSSTWGVDSWGPITYEGKQDFWSLGKGTHISLVLSETSSVALFSPPILKTGSPVPIGAFALYELDLQCISISI